jgi:hypothetical protein
VDFEESSTITQARGAKERATALWNVRFVGTAPPQISLRRSVRFENRYYLHAAFMAAALAALRICRLTRQGSRSCFMKSASSLVCL